MANINKERLLGFINDWQCQNASVETRMEYDMIGRFFRMVEEMPAEDTEQQAHWIIYDIVDNDEDYGGVEHHCSNCGFIEFYHPNTDFDDVYKFCRHCGYRIGKKY